jgi:HEAT repeat protein
VCGNGKNNISIRSDYENRNYRWDDYRHSCEEGPVQAELNVRNGVVVSMETYVAGSPREGIYKVGSREATAYLLNLAKTSEYNKVAKKAIFSSIIADSVEPYPELFAIARNESRPTEVRKDAVFWLSQAAGDKIVGDMKTLINDENTEVKKSAVFALSQMRGEESLNALMEVAKTTKDPQVRKSALFWLAQKNDPRVLAVFEDILLKH